MAIIKINYICSNADLTQEIPFKSDQECIKLLRVIRIYCIKHKLNCKLVAKDRLRTSEQDLQPFFDTEHK